jgi:hypothetical protein
LPLLEGKGPGALKIYVFGGCALHILTNARGSADVDAELQGARQVDIREVQAVFEAPEDFEQDGMDLSVVFDNQFNNALCPIHEDYEARAIPLLGQENSALQVFIASPIDLAITKLGRFTERDQDDIHTLIDRTQIDLAEFDRLAREAIDYYPCDRSSVLSCLRLVLDEAGYPHKNV